MTMPIFPDKNNAKSNAGNVATGLVLPLTNEGLRQAATRTWGNVKTYEPAEVKKVGALGRRIWMDLTFGEANNSSGQWKYKRSGKWENLPVLTIDCCIVDITGTKELVKSTPMGGNRPGPIIEHINEGGYQVAIKGIIGSKDATYPMEQVKLLHAYGKVPQAIPVAHELLYELGIYSLVFETKPSLISRPGFINLQAFEITCLSDYPVELEIKNKKDLTSNV
jgi:hypothetical protein